MENALLPGLPIDLIRKAYEEAPGNELESGKFASLESSTALAANTFGFFLERPEELPPLLGGDDWGWPAISVCLEATVRFPWAGGRHPCLDVLVQTKTHLIGIESKRYEPFRGKAKPELSDAYWREIWGDAMKSYEQVRDGLREGSFDFSRLDAAQLVKHAFGLRTEVHRQGAAQGKRPVLLYLYAEPTAWANGCPIPQVDIDRHRDEIVRFAEIVAGNEVVFHTCSYRDLLTAWSDAPSAAVRAHAEAVAGRFRPWR